MIGLINGFLNVSRLESGKMLIEKQDFKIRALLVDHIDEIQVTAMSHVIELTRCDDVTVFADREKIGIVVSNLLSNAVKYAPQAKHIQVSCQLMTGKQNDDQSAAIGSFIQVSVKDEGLGIQKEDLNQIFDRYYRVETVNTKDISGFGIGLYLSAEIIAYHGGQIWAESELGKGSTFYFTLPVSNHI